MTKTLALLFLILTATNMSAQEIDKTKPPETPALPSFKLPAVFETRLPNGLQVVLVEDRRFPLVTVRMGFQAGSKFDPKDLSGLSESTGALLTEGTAKRSSREIAEQLAGIGGSLRAASTSDALVVSGDALSENTAALLEMLADVTRNASFPEEEVALRKQNRKQELLAEYSQAAFWADKQLASEVFGSHPYSTVSPTLEAIERLDRDALVAFRNRHLLPNNAVLILLGSLPPQKEVLELIRANFGGWERQDLTSPPEAKFPVSKRAIVLVNRPDSVQADIRVGHLAVSRGSEEYFPLMVANTVLGSGASSRMFTNIREKQGFAYDAHSSLSPRRDAGMFVAVTQVRNEVLKPALEALQDEMRRLGKEPVPEAELNDVKNYITGSFVIGLETQRGLAGQLTTVKLMGLPDDYLEKFAERVRSVSASQVLAVAKKYMAPEAASFVIVGDQEKILESLKTLGEVRIEQASE